MNEKRRSKKASKGVLDGIRVIEWGSFMVGPVAGVVLASLGAEVIKIEGSSGDPGRGLKRYAGVNADLGGGINAFFEAWNLNKKGIFLDLKGRKAREVVYRLVEQSDVFLTNHRREAAKSVGLDCATLRKYNPNLIYASASGYGIKGPESSVMAYDTGGQARSGLWACAGEADQPDIVPTPVGIGDQHTGMMLAFGVVLALLARERLGIAQEVKTSLLNSLMHLNYANLSLFLLTGYPYNRTKRTAPRNPLLNWYRCGDGRFIYIVGMQSDRHWASFCHALGIEALEKDPRFCDAAAREINSKDLVPILDRAFASKSLNQWAEIFKSSDIPFTRVNRLPDLLDDPQVLENEFIVDFDHPDLGKTKFCRFPISLSKTPALIKDRAPRHGEHLNEILLERCKYNSEEIREILEEGLISD